MIEKSFPVPDCTRYTLEFPLSAIRTGGKIKRVRLSHVKEDGGAFVCAEGQTMRYLVSYALSGFYCLPAEPAYYCAQYALLYTLDSKVSRYGTGEVKYIAQCYDKSGTQVLLLLCASRILCLTASSYTVWANIPATCGTLHYERLYFGSGNRLYYSAPMDFSALKTDTTYGGGYIDFPDAAGKILQVVSYKEKLYLFRENGITAVTAFGDPLNFKTVALPYASGKIVAGSIAGCADKIYFLTEKGLHVFDGTACKRAENADEEEIDLARTVSALSYRNGYYASAYDHRGEKILYSYDGERERGRYIRCAFDFVAANDTFYFTRERTVYELSGKAFPQNGECALEVEFSLGDTKPGEKFAEWVCVSGTGGITLTLVSDRGEETAVKGICGKTVRLPRALRGESFLLKITPEQEDFEIKALSVGARRDDA